MKICLLTLILGCFCFQQSVQYSEQDLPVVTVFYEPLCPYCKNFIVNILYPTYSDLEQMMQLDFISYGNVQRQKKDGSWTFDCQHGPEECAISKLEICGIAKTRSQKLRMEYVYCIENEVDNTTDIHSLAKCADKLQLPAEEVLKCAEGPEGNELFGLLGEKQQALAPDLNGVPTIYVNYKDLDDYTTLKKTLCDLLHNKPAGCKQQK